MGNGSTVSKGDMLEALARGVRWLLDLQNEDGSVCSEEGLGAYYKVPWAYSAGGYSVEASRLLAWVRANAMAPSGDFVGAFPRGPVHEAIYPYANSWLVCGAHRLGCFDISQKGMDFLETLQGPSGGFYSSPGRLEQDVMCTCMAGMAALYTGRVGRAVRVASFLQRLWDVQTEPERFLFFVWREGFGLVTEFPSQQASSYVVHAGEDWQWYFIPGIAAAFLASCYMATGNRDYLELGSSYLKFAGRCGDYVYRRAQGGKVGWGAALMYSLTGEECYRQVALRVGQYLVESQQADGSWQNPAAGGARYTAVDVTAEFVVWLSEMMRYV
ncbi:MAG TPA: hypothetical protein GX513_12455 [Firmicutes bacterium]|nr:hypothetical protein [Bacillota bacterium]